LTFAGKCAQVVALTTTPRALPFFLLAFLVLGTDKAKPFKAKPNGWFGIENGPDPLFPRPSDNQAGAQVA